MSWTFDGVLTVADSTFDFSNEAKSAGIGKEIFNIVCQNNVMIRGNILLDERNENIKEISYYQEQQCWIWFSSLY